MRLVNRPLAFILAAALAVAAVIVIIEVITAAVHHGPLLLHWTTWYQWASRTRWDQLVIQVWSAILIVIGAAILALELKPRRVTRLPLRSGHDATDAAVTRRGPGRGPAGSGDRGRRGLRRRGHRPPPPRPRHRHRRRPGPHRHRSAPATCHPGAAGPARRPGPAPPAAPPRARQLPEPLMHADRTNRVGLTLFGLLVLAVGAAGMIASTGVSGEAFSRRTLFANRVSIYIGHHSWVWYAAAGLCLVITLLALRWIVALLISTDRAGDIPVPVATHEGTTILRPAALTGAVTREIGTYHGVDTARARIIGDAADPEIVIAVTASQTTDLRALHQRIETQALSHVRHAVGNTSLPIQLHLDVSRRTT